MKGRKVIYLFLFGISITRNGNANAGLCTANYAREKRLSQKGGLFYFLCGGEVLLLLSCCFLDIAAGVMV